MIIGKKQIDDLRIKSNEIKGAEIVDEIAIRQQRKKEASQQIRTSLDSYKTQTYVRPYKEFASDLRKVKPIQEEKKQYVMPKFVPYVAPIKSVMNIVDEKGEKEERSL